MANTPLCNMVKRNSQLLFLRILHTGFSRARKQRKNRRSALRKGVAGPSEAGTLTGRPGLYSLWTATYITPEGAERGQTCVARHLLYLTVAVSVRDAVKIRFELWEGLCYNHSRKSRAASSVR